MKKFFALACAALLTVPAFAQFTTGGGASASTAANTDSYDQVGIYYNNSHFSYDYPGEHDPDPINTNGFALQWLHGFSVSKSLPMFVEAGLNFNFNVGSQDADKEESDTYEGQKYQYAALAIPVNFAYKWNVNESIAIKPYLGLNLKFNLLGREKTQITDKYREYLEDREYDDILEDYDKWYSFFSKDDMDGKEFTWNRFQLGWHIGVDFSFNKFFVGINYGTDFIPAQKYKKYKTNSSTLNLGVGLYF